MKNYTPKHAVYNFGGGQQGSDNNPNANFTNQFLQQLGQVQGQRPQIQPQPPQWGVNPVRRFQPFDYNSLIRSAGFQNDRAHQPFAGNFLPPVATDPAQSPYPVSAGTGGSPNNPGPAIQPGAWNPMSGPYPGWNQNVPNAWGTTGGK